MRRMVPGWIRASAAAVAAWLPLFVVWALVTMSFGRALSAAVVIESLISTGTAGMLGVAVWLSCRRWPWPLGFSVTFYALQILLAVVYGFAWTLVVKLLLATRGEHIGTSWPGFARQVAMGVWFYAVFAGMAHTVQTRNRLHEQEKAAVRAEAVAATARLDALRARLNPHFLFNALHTLGALVKFRPSIAEAAIQRLGDMLRYALTEDSRGLVAFAQEYDFTCQYLAFEQLRYEERLKVNLRVDPDSFNFDLPPFCIQTLAENAVRHAVATRPDGGSIWIACQCADGRLQVSVRDDGPGDVPEIGESHQFGLRAVRERLRVAFGSSAHLSIEHRDGFQATFVIPLTDDESYQRGEPDDPNSSDR
jgi:LytS/YehU family sensor histidine kinase